jgi:hypothetical protein
MNFKFISKISMRTIVLFVLFLSATFTVSCSKAGGGSHPSNGGGGGGGGGDNANKLIAKTPSVSCDSNDKNNFCVWEALSNNKSVQVQLTVDTGFVTGFTLLASPNDFTVKGDQNCTTTISAGAPCTLTITYSPQTATPDYPNPQSTAFKFSYTNNLNAVVNASFSLNYTAASLQNTPIDWDSTEGNFADFLQLNYMTMPSGNGGAGDDLRFDLYTNDHQQKSDYTFSLITNSSDQISPMKDHILKFEIVPQTGSPILTDMDNHFYLYDRTLQQYLQLVDPTAMGETILQYAVAPKNTLDNKSYLYGTTNDGDKNTPAGSLLRFDPTSIVLNTSLVGELWSTPLPADFPQNRTPTQFAAVADSTQPLVYTLMGFVDEADRSQYKRYVCASDTRTKNNFGCTYVDTFGTMIDEDGPEFAQIGADGVIYFQMYDEAGNLKLYAYKVVYEDGSIHLVSLFDPKVVPLTPAPKPYPIPITGYDPTAPMAYDSTHNLLYVVVPKGGQFILEAIDVTPNGPRVGQIAWSSQPFTALSKPFMVNGGKNVLVVADTGKVYVYNGDGTSAFATPDSAYTLEAGAKVVTNLVDWDPNTKILHIPANVGTTSKIYTLNTNW